MATKLSMAEPNPGIWFKFDDNDPKSGDIGLRPLNQAKREELRKKCIKKRIEYKKGQRFEIDDPNEDLFSEMLWDYVITGWSGLVDDDERDIPCTAENKAFFMRNHVGFAKFVDDRLEKINTEYEQKLEAETANLSKGSVGSETLENQVAIGAGS